MKTWTPVKTNLPNLHLLTIEGKKIGFTFNPGSSPGELNAWRIFLGIGENARLVGHAWTLPSAKRILESVA